MQILRNKTSVIAIIAVFFSVYVTNLSAAATQIEEACLKFVDGQWFTAENLNVHMPGEWCQWSDDSFRVEDGLVRTYMSLTFWDGLSPEYRRKNLGKEIIGNPNTANGALQIGDEKEDSSDWSKLLEFPIGDYGITYQHGNKYSYQTLLGGVTFYFIVDGCTVKIGGSEIVDRQKDPK
ncbi:MAG: hypothetical protein HY454_01130, partial [Parcubacteria group bacterium]|nr:hypothetical protein [Parcubacteria group bacterium]